MDHEWSGVPVWFLAPSAASLGFRMTLGGPDGVSPYGVTI